MLPLDLHVLGLSLAFILSQDQTLHDNISFILNFLFLVAARVSRELTPGISTGMPRFSTFVFLTFTSNILKEL